MCLKRFTPPCAHAQRGATSRRMRACGVPPRPACNCLRNVIAVESTSACLLNCASWLAETSASSQRCVSPAMASLKLVLGTLMIVAALYRFLHASDEADHRSTLCAEGCKRRASSLLSLAFRRRLSAMDKADRTVCIRVFLCESTATCINRRSCLPSERQPWLLAEAAAALCRRH